jgi:hypothetical protein
MNDERPCPRCRSLNTLECDGDPDEDGQTEFHCNACGEYFVDTARPEETL